MFSAYFNVCGLFTPGLNMHVKHPDHPDLATIRGNMNLADDVSDNSLRISTL